jgi:hypothetical protein
MGKEKSPKIRLSQNRNKSNSKRARSELNQNPKRANPNEQDQIKYNYDPESKSKRARGQKSRAINRSPYRQLSMASKQEVMDVGKWLSLTCSVPVPLLERGNVENTIPFRAYRGVA